MNQKLSMNFFLYVIVLTLSSFFLAGTEKVIYLPVFSPKHLRLPLNSFANY